MRTLAKAEGYRRMRASPDLRGSEAVYLISAIAEATQLDAIYAELLDNCAPYLVIQQKTIEQP